jgi:hypothetical protein
MTADEEKVLIIGPTCYGMFLIASSENRVWDGKEWRGFGEAERYLTFADAFKARKQAKQKLTERGH